MGAYLLTLAQTLQADCKDYLDISRLPPTAKCLTDSADNMTIELNGPSHIEWRDFRVDGMKTLTFLSLNKGKFASLNTVRNIAVRASSIKGAVTADGPFLLINKDGIVLESKGEIVAPSVFLSTLSPTENSLLLAGETTSFSDIGGGQRVFLDGIVTATEGSLVALSSGISVFSKAQLTATRGRVQLIAANNGVSGPDRMEHFTSLFAGQPTTNGATNSGVIKAREIEIIAHGTITNGGTLESRPKKHALPGNFVRLTAPEISLGPRSKIHTNHFDPSVRVMRVGRVIGPDDGSNPGAVSSTLQIPAFTTAASKVAPPQAATVIQPGLLSYTHLQTRDAAAPREVSRSGSQIATRSGDGGAPKRKGKTLVARSSFFGTVR